ncbi:MAG: endonuclease MutS2 [Oscillospiraceae bacterium]|jgi:DNA mismatch repair protein MutS2|nr:endonuclease MutS2 [Oscillospiraceae bacterium]
MKKDLKNKSTNIDNLGMKSLEFSKILALLSGFCACKESKNKTEKLDINASLERALELLKETSTAFDIINNFSEIPIGSIKNIKPHIKRAENQAILSLGELLDVKHVLFSVQSCADWSKNLKDRLGVLSDRVLSLFPNKHLFNRIDSSIISQEEVADSASKELLFLRNKKRSLSLKIRETLDNIIRSTHYQKFLQEPIVTMRNSRFVIPVKTEHRSEIEGLLHDSSSSGSTAFIEPKQVLEANNQISSLNLQEKREIEKILLQLSSEVSNFSKTLHLNYELLIELDMIFARARLAKSMKALPPKLNNCKNILLKKARHPLIPKEKVVPIDIVFGKETDCLMVTGPNTGGKTVSMKVVGIFASMVKLGLMIPAEEGSEMCVFNKIFVDIGDEQSIEQSLSTFSGHILKLVKITEFADENSLVLLDELGAGTDPEQGSALALSIVEYLKSKKSKVMITTHYPVLKEYAFSSESSQNACCEFDIETLMPTYKLITGIPGCSNALEIAKRLGIREEIIQKAYKLMPSSSQKLDFVIKELKVEKKQAELKNQELAKLITQAKKIKDEASSEKKKIQNQSEVFLKNAKLKSREIIEKARKEAGDFILELKKMKKKSNLTIDDRTKINKGLKSLDDSLYEKNKPLNEHKSPAKLGTGDNVFIVDMNRQATVLEIHDKGKTVTVSAGNVKLKINISRLELLPKSSAKKNKKGNISTKYVKKQPMAAVSEIDLRGHYVLDAIEELDRFIDSALLSGVSQIKIIHGKGTQALMRQVSQHLKSHKHVEGFRKGGYTEGGIGATIARLI